MRRKHTVSNCIINNCPSIATCRGLCGSCYNIARKMIADKEATDEELVKKGMMLPGKKATSFFRDQFRANPFRTQFLK